MNDFKKQLMVAYDADAKRRDNADGKRDHWKNDLREDFVNLLKSENKKTILELGSGAGIDSRYFADNGLDVLATDLSKEMIKMCKKRGLNTKILDLYSLGTLNKTFDAVFSLNVLLHVPRKDLDKVLGGIYNILNPGGIFFYGVYGGMDEEKVITDEHKMNLPRLFSFLSDKTLLDVPKGKFEVIKFKTIDVGSNTPSFHFQSLLLRKKS